MFPLHALGAQPDHGDIDQAQVRLVEQLMQAPAPLLEWLRQRIDWPTDTHVVTLRPSRIWPGKKGTLTFELSLKISRGGCTESFLLQGQAGQADPAKAQHREPRFGLGGYLLGIRIASEELGLSLWSPDQDAQLPAARRILRGDVPDGEPIADHAANGANRSSYRIVAYRAGKRCTFAEVLPHGGGIGAYYKVFRRMPVILRDHYPGAFAEALERRSGGRIRIPLAQRICPDDKMLVSEPVAFDAEHAPDGMIRVNVAAELLAALHDLSLDFMDKLSVHDAKKELETVGRWLGCSQRFGHLSESKAAEFWAGIGALAPAAATAPTRIAHRDFYESQLQHDGDHIYLTDLDTIALAHGEVDVATYIAHELLDELESGGTVETGKQKGEALVARYLSCGGRIDAGRLRFYLGCAMTRLGCIHSMRNVDKNIITSLWGIGESQIDGSWEITHG